MSVKQAIDSGAFNDQEPGSSVINATTVNATTVNATTVNTDIIASNNEFGLIFDCQTGLQMNINGTTGGFGSALTSSGTYASWTAIPYPSITVAQLSYQVTGDSLLFNKPNNMSTSMAMINVSNSTTSIAIINTVSAFQVNQIDNTGATISTRNAPFNFVNPSTGLGIGAVTVYVPVNCATINITIPGQNILSFFATIDFVKCS